MPFWLIFNKMNIQKNLNNEKEFDMNMMPEKVQNFEHQNLTQNTDNAFFNKNMPMWNQHSDQPTTNQSLETHDINCTCYDCNKLNTHTANMTNNTENNIPGFGNM
jgi:hypothetical protein